MADPHPLNTEPDIGVLPLHVIEEALAGSRKVLRSGSGWSTVSQRQIIAMAILVGVLDPENAPPKPEEGDGGDEVAAP